MPNTRQLKSRMVSIRNTKQITRAMEAVAATKMRKAQEVAIKARPYAEAAMAMLAELPGATRQAHPLFREHSKGSDLYILIGSDKGLCGGYNSGVTRAFIEHVRKQSSGQPLVLCVGRKMRQFTDRRGYEHAGHAMSSEGSTFENAQFINEVAAAYAEQKYRRVFLGFTRFLSTLKQEAVVRQLLPFTKATLDEIVQGIIPQRGRYAELREAVKEEVKEQAPLRPFVYEFEPTIEAILTDVLQALLRVAMYHALVEAEASEQSARMVAMKSASENATGLLETLRLTFNKARQMAITREVAEITTGKEALESA